MLSRVAGRGDEEARGCMYFDSDRRFWEGYFCKTLMQFLPPQAIINKTKPCTCISLKYNEILFEILVLSCIVQRLLIITSRFGTASYAL